MTLFNRAITKRWIRTANRQELDEVMNEAMLSSLQKDIIIKRRKKDSIVSISLAVKFSVSKINKEIADACDCIAHALKAMGKF